MKQQFDLKTHEAELLEERLKQSTHHQQLTEIEELEQSISMYNNHFTKIILILLLQQFLLTHVLFTGVIILILNKYLLMPT